MKDGMTKTEKYELLSINPDTHVDLQSEATENVYHHVGRRLRELRSGRNMTQAQVATLIGVSPQQYQKYEEAQSKCSLTNLLILADYYSIDLAGLLPSKEHRVRSNMNDEADLLARLVAAYTKLNDVTEKIRLVQLLEAMAASGSNKSN